MGLCGRPRKSEAPCHRPRATSLDLFSESPGQVPVVTARGARAVRPGGPWGRGRVGHLLVATPRNLPPPALEGCVPAAAFAMRDSEWHSHDTH